MARDKFNESELRYNDILRLRFLALLMRNYQLILNKLGREADLDASMNFLHIQKSLDRPQKITWMD